MLSNKTLQYKAEFSNLGRRNSPPLRFKYTGLAQEAGGEKALCPSQGPHGVTTPLQRLVFSGALVRFSRTTWIPK